MSCDITGAMAMTMMGLNVGLRDRLAHLVRDHYNGATLAEALERLIEEHEINDAVEAVDRTRREHPEEWEDYRAEAAEWEEATADGLGAAREEYPEYQW